MYWLGWSCREPGPGPQVPEMTGGHRSQQGGCVRVSEPRSWDPRGEGGVRAQPGNREENSDQRQWWESERSGAEHTRGCEGRGWGSAPSVRQAGPDGAAEVVMCVRVCVCVYMCV